MNSSSSNSNQGFSSFNETNPVLGFNSPALPASRRPGAGVAPSSGSNLSRPRLMKVRKQSSSHNHKPTNSMDSRMLGNDRGLGFNQFRSSFGSALGSSSSGNVANETFLFGVNGNDSNSRINSNAILDDMAKLKINSDNDYANATKDNSSINLNDVDKSIADDLQNEISKLNIEGESNIGNVNSNIAEQLQNEMEKMNIKDPTNATSSSFTSSNFQSFGSTSFTNKSEQMSEFAFTSKLDNIGTPFVEFKTPDMKTNMFSGFNRFEPKKESVNETRSKKKKGKPKIRIVGQSRVREDLGFNQRSLSGNSDTFESYSPMDISPYEEKLADNYSRETSVTSDDNTSQINDQNNVSNVTTDDEVFEPYITEVSETESFKSATENLENSNDTFVTAFDADDSSTATSSRQENLFNFGSKSENINKGNFTFAASSNSQSQLPSDTRQHKKKIPLKIVRDPYDSKSAEFFPVSGISSILSPGTGLKGDLSKINDNFIPVNEQNLRHETLTNLSSSKMAEETCEKWRLRGNQAYSNGDLTKAEDYYTKGLNSISKNEKSERCLRALMLCYSNRAATRIPLGRIKEALGDCLMAANIDPNFLKVQLRAAHCYLAMGEIENAKKQYMKCLQSDADKKVIEEASQGLEKTQKVSECIKQCTDLLQKQAYEDLECALRVINEAIQISSCSEKLVQMKANTLFMLRRYEEVIQVCEQTLTSDDTDTTSRLWKSQLIIKSYFYLGRLNDALEFIKKHENSEHNITERVGNTSQESAIPLADTISQLLSHKTAGNEAYKAGKHTEAVEHYTTALSCNLISRPFTSICFCNRAAAYRALNQITDAIADCSIAIALDPTYLKAISRRASLYEMIRDYGEAAKDLQKLVSHLTTDKLSCVNELKQTQLQLSNVEEQSRKGIPLNMYLILGVESTASAADIKKAYRKAALRHHPDKAAQSLGRSDDGDDGLWKEIAENVHKDADRLFKMIGEAYAILSNPTKRSRYDEDEEMRSEANKFSRSNSSRMATDVQNSVFEPSGSRRQWQETSQSFRYSRYY